MIVFFGLACMKKNEVTTNQSTDRTFMSNVLECVYVYHKSIYSQWMRVLSLRPYFQYLLLSRTHCAWIVLDPSARFLSTLLNSFFLRVTTNPDVSVRVFFKDSQREAV